MHRSTVDRGLNYSPQDILLFRESPFASWMERLTVDNPDHGIVPDWSHNPKTHQSVHRSDEHFTKFQKKASSVETVTWIEFVRNRQPERPTKNSSRYNTDNSRQNNTDDIVILDRCSGDNMDGSETMAAMHRGVQFVVNAQLVGAPLSCTVDMLIRSSGVSTLGNYLYLPCVTKTQTNGNSALGLSFAADLLESIQGKLPPQMLVIPSGGEMTTYKTEDYIYHYRAVKKRFLEAQGTFKKHRIPAPEDSSHFGRWSQCANDIMKRRALNKSFSDEPTPEAAAAPTLTGKPPGPISVYVDRDLPDKNYAKKNCRAAAADAAAADAA